MPDILDGYEALRKRSAWTDLSGRGKIRVTGDDRARLLHAMTTNHIQQLTPGTGCYAYFLSAQGRILADVNVFAREDEFLLDTELETRVKVFDHVDRYIIADDVNLDDVTEATATIAIEGPASAEALRQLGAPTPEEEYATAAWQNRLVARTSFTGGPGFFVFAPAEERHELTDKLPLMGVEWASPAALNVVRLEQGKPRYGDDLSERFLAQEANQPHALNFNKGCYLGQEIVERVRSRGQIHRVLMPLEIDAAEAPPAGTKLMQEGASLAEITSAAYSPALGKVVALGYVRTDKATPGTEFKFGDTLVRVGRPRSGGTGCE